jgi:hypothetical protein
VQVVFERFVLARFALREHGDEAAGRHGLVDEADGALAGHGQRHEGVREQHRVAQRQHGQFFWYAERLFVRRDVRFYPIAGFAHVIHSQE